MSNRRRKPADPQEIARRRADRVANETEIARLRSQGAVVSLDRARRIVAARRSNVFKKLLETHAISAGQAGAADRLIEDWATWRGLDGRPERPEVHAENYSTAEFVTDRMLQAGRRVSRILERIGPLDRDLLAVMVASIVEDDRPLPWRDLVRRVSGITQTVRQSAAVAGALENLSRAYQGR